MSSFLKPLFATIVLTASAAPLVHAEQFDSSYSDDGRYIESVGSAHRTALAMLETPTGQIVQVSAVSGGCGGSPVCPRLTLLTANGAYITSFGVSLTSSNGMESASGAAIDSRGRIIVVGTSTPSVGARNFRILRFLPNGDLDTSFAGDGNTDVDFFGVDDYATAVAVDANDNVIVVGQAGRSATDTDFGVARLRGTDGTPDTSFSGDGKATVYFDLGATQKFDAPRAVAIAASGGRISVAGIAYDNAISRYRVALARLNGDGTPDTSFCATTCTVQGSYTSINNGRRVYYFGSNTVHSDTAAGIALAGNGDFFIVGETYATDGSGKRAAIARFAANGDYVAEALNDGLGNNAAYRSVQLSDANGQRVLVGGDSGPEGNYLLLQAFSFGLTPLAGYGDCLNTTGFCFIGGTGLGDNGPDQAAALTLDRNGRPLFAGSFVAASGDFDKSVFARFTNATGPRPDLIFRNGF
ncbi:MAG: hypothetical protein IPP82_00880 [Xanthomonadales bacterium]|nr:hypothetical protein [Xanthomonadales bacterium]